MKGGVRIYWSFCAAVIAGVGDKVRVISVMKDGFVSCKFVISGMALNDYCGPSDESRVVSD